MKVFSGKNKYFIVVALVFTFALTPITHNLATQKAEAFLGDSASYIAKEYGFDVVAWLAINMVLEEIIIAMTDWVKSGFKGSPAFVTDFDGFLLDTADKAAGEFLLLDGPLEFLCSPFKLDIRLAIQANYLSRGAYYKPECSLSEAIDNVDAFLAGDFSQGGWDGWASMTLNPRNNLYGSLLTAQGEFEIAIQGAKRQEIDYLSFGGGFFGVEECDEDGNCYRVTPGSVVEDALNNTLNLGNERLTVGDELSEFIAALLSQLLSSVLGNEGGLASFDATQQDNQYNPIFADAQTQIDAGREELFEQPSLPGSEYEDEYIYAAEKAACDAVSGQKWDVRCNECVADEDRPGDICNWEDQPLAYSCSQLPGDSCTDTCDELGGTYDSRAGTCIFTNGQVRNTIMYCDFADSDAMTYEECLSTCYSSMEGRRDFGGFVSLPLVERLDFGENPVYTRQWCSAAYIRSDY